MSILQSINCVRRIFTRLNTEAYTSNRFFVLDLAANYEFKKDWILFGTVSNLTNQAWENTYTNYLGIGSWPQPGRSFMLGVKYKF